MRDGWSRRAVLGAMGGAGVAAAVSGCGIFDREQPAAPDPLEPLLASAWALAAQQEAAIAAYPELAERLGPLQEAHRAHEAALLELIGRPELATSSPPAAVWSAPVDATSSPDEAVAALREAERAGAGEAAQACLAAPPERALLLGSIAAARATHAEVLG